MKEVYDRREIECFVKTTCETMPTFVINRLARQLLAEMDKAANACGNCHAIRELEGQFRSSQEYIKTYVSEPHVWEHAPGFVVDATVTFFNSVGKPVRQWKYKREQQKTETLMIAEGLYDALDMTEKSRETDIQSIVDALEAVKNESR